jgi:nitrogen regulatory protein P-II 1
MVFCLTLGMKGNSSSQKGQPERYRGSEYTVNFLSKLNIELIVEESQVDMVDNTIERVTRTGEIGEGKIFITPIERIIRILTGDKDFEAI